MRRVPALLLVLVMAATTVVASPVTCLAGPAPVLSSHGCCSEQMPVLVQASPGCCALVPDHTQGGPVPSRVSSPEPVTAALDAPWLQGPVRRHAVPLVDPPRATRAAVPLYLQQLALLI